MMPMTIAAIMGARLSGDKKLAIHCGIQPDLGDYARHSAPSNPLGGGDRRHYQTEHAKATRELSFAPENSGVTGIGSNRGQFVDSRDIIYAGAP
jgi:hypothetical protein